MADTASESGALGDPFIEFDRALTDLMSVAIGSDPEERHHDEVLERARECVEVLYERASSLSASDGVLRADFVAEQIFTAGRRRAAEPAYLLRLHLSAAYDVALKLMDRLEEAKRFPDSSRARRRALRLQACLMDAHGLVLDSDVLARDPDRARRIRQRKSLANAAAGSAAALACAYEGALGPVEVDIGSHRHFVAASLVGEFAPLFVRHSLEMYAVELLGVWDVRTQDGREVKVTGKTFLDLIREAGQAITTPVPPAILLALYAWSNIFIHSGIPPFAWESVYAADWLAKLYMGELHYQRNGSMTAAFEAARATWLPARLQVLARLNAPPLLRLRAPMHVRVSAP